MFTMDDTVFIQIGSNEGVMPTDPLYSMILKDQWKGILIEPDPFIFEKLKSNYANRSHLYFENVAISDSRKICDFFVVDENARPQLVNEAGGPWGSLVGSLDREHIFKHKPGITEKEIKTIQVQCVTFQDIVEKYRLERVDVLHIDAEGHDETILASIDFKKIQPKVIVFEHMHMGFVNYLNCIGRLESFGYSVLYTGPRDTVVGL